MLLLDKLYQNIIMKSIFGRNYDRAFKLDYFLELVKTFKKNSMDSESCIRIFYGAYVYEIDDILKIVS